MFRGDLPRAFCHTHIVALIWPDSHIGCATTSSKIEATNSVRTYEKSIVSCGTGNAVFKKLMLGKLGNLLLKCATWILNLAIETFNCLTNHFIILYTLFEDSNEQSNSYPIVLSPHRDCIR
jgi:hypothetical protein